MSFIRENAVYPKMYRIRQNFSNDKVDDIKAEVFKEFNLIDLKDKIKKGGSIGVTCGSRGINNIDKIVKAVVDYVRECGGVPCIIQLWEAMAEPLLRDKNMFVRNLA